MSYAGNLQQGKIYVEKGLSFAIKSNNVFNMGLSELHHGWYCLIKGDGKHTIRHSKNSIVYFDKGNWPWLLAGSWSSLGYGYYLIGEFETAREHIKTGWDIHRSTPVSWFLSVYPCFLSFVHHDTGNFIEAQSCAEEALELSQKNSENHSEGLSRISLGRILGKMSASKRTEAEEYILLGIKILKEHKLLPWLSQGYFFLGELYANIDQKHKAFENLNKAMAMCQEMGIDYWPDKIQEVLDRL